MSRPPHNRTEIPEGFHVVAVPEAIGHWRPADGRPCRYARQGHVQCGQLSIAEVLRGDKRPQWWAYCGDHSYRRWVETGRVWHWILRADNDEFEVAG